MELSDISFVEHEFELLHPMTDKPLKIFLTIQSLESPDVKRIERRIRDEALRLRARGKTFKAEQIDNNTIELMVAAIIGWRWENPDVTLDGETNPTFSIKNVKSLLQKPWVIQQIDEQLEERKNFFKV